MSGLNAEEVRVALSGHVYYLPPGVDVPTDFTVPKGAIDLGYTTEDGVTFTFGKDTEDLMGWQSMEPLRRLVTASPKTCAFTLRQLSRDTWLSTMGGTLNKGTGETFTWTPNDAEQTEGAIIVEFIDGDSRGRFGFRRAAQTAEVEFQLVRTDAINLPNEWSALATADGTPTAFAVFQDKAFAESSAGAAAGPAASA